MSQEEMKKLTAKEMMVQETAGVLGRHSQVSDAVRSMGMAAPLSSQLSFQATSYPVGRFPSGVAVGDFTNDGNLDIIVVNALDNTVSVLLNNGDGTFQEPPLTYNVGANPAGVAVGDFANNGYLDFVTANQEDNTVSFLLRPVVPWALSASVGTRPSGVAVGDFANNGYLGIVTANQDSTVSVLLTPFGPEYSYNVGQGPIAVAVGDFTNDGNLDIVTVNALDSTVSVLLNNGDGTFKQHQDYDVGAFPWGVAVGDFNGDGYLGIVTANNDDHTVSILLNNGDGTFQEPPLTFPVGQGPIAVAVGDFTNDGNLDIVTANYNANTVSVLLGNGDGTFQEPPLTFPVGSGPWAWSVAVGDFNHDGYLDIVTADSDGNTVTVLLQQPPSPQSPSLTVQVNTIYPTAQSPFSGAVATISGVGSANDTTASIDWGDGTPATSGSVSANPDGTLTVSGTHTYTTSGPFTLTVIADEGTTLSGQGTGQAIVQPPLPPPVVRVNTIHATAFFPFTGAVATINGNYSYVRIDWGDGSDPTTGAVSANPNGTLTVTDTHSYDPGTYTLTVSATDSLGENSFQGTGTAIVILPVQANTIHATAQEPFGGAVAIISGLFDFDTTASIEWGDGTATTSGSVSANPDGTLTVSGTHTYTTPGTFPLNVSVTSGIVSGQQTGQAMVSSGLAVQVNTIYSTEQVDFLGAVATISGASSGPLFVTIDWGDGTSGQPNVFSENPGGTLSVIAEHTYLTRGTFVLTVSVIDEGGGGNTVQGTGQAIVQPGLEVQVNTIQATAYVPFSGAVAMMSGASSASDTTAWIGWGDGLFTSGTVSANTDGTLTASGTHTYTTAGTYTLTVSADEGTLHAQGTGQAIVQSAPGVQVVHVNTIQATAHVPFHGTVATISGARRASDTRVMINWGDGTAATPGTVIANHTGTLRVSGSHIYSRGGTFLVTIKVKEGAHTVTGKGRAIVKAARLHARAFGVQSLTPPQSPFGDVSIPSTGGTHTVTVPSVRLPGNGLSVRTITNRVSGALTTAPPLASASSEIGDLHGFGIAASGITATAHGDMSWPSGEHKLRGTTTFATLTIGSMTFPAHFAPQANRVIPFADGSGTVTLNEQTVTRRGNRLLVVVNALHLRITTGPQVGTDIVVGHAEAGITLS
ncbi:FG-GAP repeat domain-containing protein [Ktedonospora formicarum]|uniref:PKD domain-containing protein n=1 Tax=Ktedonospora formicarum TaxID=2778364 RepID=A0A8J3MWR1_9CHLR|nr:VCBS repeat-containing protein [Ktedonospora formicarum]GHO48928.1 hypothetical protein KSX_70910 [Ktedonospora formicarum]